MLNKRLKKSVYLFLAIVVTFLLFALVNISSKQPAALPECTQSMNLEKELFHPSKKRYCTVVFIIPSAPSK